MRFRLLLAAFLAAALPALAQVPPLPDADRSYTYTVSAPTSVFAVPFAVYGDCTDLDVFENGILQSPETYTCASASGATIRPVVDDQITLSTPLAQGTLQIIGDYRPRNLTMPTAPGITRSEFNRTVNTILAGMRETRAKADLATPPQLYGFWDPGTNYPPNAVVGFGGQEWQAAQGSLNQQPVAGSPYWTAVVSPPQQVIFSTPTLPGLPTNILAAPTVDLGTSATHFVNVTGSGTIASFGSSCSSAAPVYYVTFGGVDTLVQSVNLHLPGYANITTATNDAAVVQCLGGGVSQIVGYLPFANPPAVSVPSGAVMAFNLGNCPTGWVLSNGQNGTIDARGVVIRGQDAGRGLDPNRVAGTYQADALENFGVTSNVATSNGSLDSGSTGILSLNFTPGGTVAGVPSAPAAGQINAGVAPSLATETRMKNVALLYCQKS